MNSIGTAMTTKVAATPMEFQKRGSASSTA